MPRGAAVLAAVLVPVTFLALAMMQLSAEPLPAAPAAQPAPSGAPAVSLPPLPALELRPLPPLPSPAVPPATPAVQPAAAPAAPPAAQPAAHPAAPPTVQPEGPDLPQPGAELQPDWVPLRRRLTEAARSLPAEQAQPLLQRLGELHRRRLARLPQQHQHFPRAAGTAVCGMVPRWRNKVVDAVKEVTNCWLEGHGPWWFGPAHGWSGVNRTPQQRPCAATDYWRQKKGNGAGFIAPERAVDDSVAQSRRLCPQFAHSVVVREPVSRALSHYCLADEFGRRTASSPLPLAGPDPRVLDVFPAITDNAMTRYLAGVEAVGLPRGALSRDNHLQTALALLRQMDVVFPMDEFGKERGRLFARAMGWGAGARLGDKKSSKRPQCQLTHERHGKALAADNALDAELYKEAGRLFEVDRVLWEALGDSEARWVG